MSACGVLLAPRPLLEFLKSMLTLTGALVVTSLVIFAIAALIPASTADALERLVIEESKVAVMLRLDAEAGAMLMKTPRPRPKWQVSLAGIF